MSPRPLRAPVLAVSSIIAVLASTAGAAPISLTSTTDESGYNGGTLASIPLTANGAFVPTNAPWTFDPALVSQLDAIDTISISLILGSADSQPGGVNFDKMTLALDGIDTGIKLNGTWQIIKNPPNDDIRPPLVFTGTVTDPAAVLAALKADNKLVGTIRHTSPGNDFITLGSTQGSFGPTTLVINGLATDAVPPTPAAVPFPPALWAALPMLLALGAVGQRRLRKSLI